MYNAKRETRIFHNAESRRIRITMLVCTNETNETSTLVNFIIIVPCQDRWAFRARPFSVTLPMWFCKIRSVHQYRCTDDFANICVSSSERYIRRGRFFVQFANDYEYTTQLLILRFVLNSSWDSFVTTNKLGVANRDRNLINFGRTKMLDKIVVLSNYEQRMKISNYIWKQTVWTLFFLFYPLNTRIG